MKPSFILRLWRRSRSEHGQALVLFAAGLAGFCGLVGMAIDVGQVVYRKADLQKAADAAALAGAQDLDGSVAGATAAIAAADSYVAKNGYAGAACRPNCASVPAPYDTITVNLSQQVNYTFLKVVGLSSATPSASAASKYIKKTITGYNINQTAPFIIWGGSRAHEVNADDAGQPLHIRVGNSYTFLDTGWMGANGSPTGPDWTANGSNNFKGDIDHGEGADIVEVGDSRTVTSNGGLGNVTPPAVGSTIVIPVMSKASGNANARTFTIAAWVEVQVNSGCSKQHCTGKVLGSARAPAGMTTSTSGTVQPPATIAQFVARGSLLR